RGQRWPDCAHRSHSRSKRASCGRVDFQGGCGRAAHGYTHYTRYDRHSIDQRHAGVIAIIDYGAGNLRSIRRALETNGAEPVITSDPDVVRKADAVVLPGVGHAGHAIGEIER